MQLLACLWIVLCLVIDTSTKSVTNTKDETSIEDLPIPLHLNADGNLTKEDCKCQNGFCKENDKGKFVCTCPPEWGLYYPTTCEKCNCGKESNCTFGGYWERTKICICKDGYEHSYEQRGGVCKGTCKTNPCLNGGQCIVKGNDIECKCKDLFSGERCEKVPCNETEDCKNGGICEKSGDKSFCRCRTGTGGPFCEDVPACADMNCGQDAECLYNVQLEKPLCQCLNNSLSFDPEDKRCKRTCFEDTNCMNGAECESSGMAKFCKCLKDTEGDYCEEISECKALNCEPSAQCTYDVQMQTAMCLCADEDFYFDYKQRKCRNFCSPNPCQNGGICNATRGEATCQCKDRFRGADCSIDVCSPNPCRNDGNCTATRGQAMCQCRHPFTGADCSINVCSPNPCQNGGVCNATKEGAICHCRHRFIGSDCSIEIPLISTSTSLEMLNITRNSTIHPTYHPTSNPSGHSLNFTVGMKSTLRLTTLVQTTGEDPCTESPCQNGGTCVVVGNRPKCLCKKPYLGNLCETDPCDWYPCKNGGVCKTEYETVRCFCKEPFTGEFCESRIRIDTYVVTLLAASVFLAIILTFVTCMLCQRYHAMRARTENS